MNFFRSAVGATVVVLGVHAGCGGDPQEGNTVGSSGGSGGKSGSGSGASSGSGVSGAGSSGTFSGTGGEGGSLGGTSGTGPLDFDGCAATDYTADAQPVDIYIMFDQSVSTEGLTGNGQTIWVSMVDALKQFLDDPSSTGIRVGIQYFGLPGQGVPGCGVSCNPADYAVPEVPIAELPGVAGAIKASLDAHGPSNFTPTGPALEGALQHAQAHAALNPDRLTAVVLATDGYPAVPAQCDPCGSTGENLNAIRQLAANAAMANPKVLTFVIGVGGVSNLNGIAQSGGTGAAFVIDDKSGDVAAQFSQAMRSIATTPLDCTFGLPQPADGGMLDTNLVNIVFTAPGGMPELIFRVNTPSDCGTVGKGWFYQLDSGMKPIGIELCPGVCGTLGAGKLQIVLGCATQPPPT